MLKVPPELIVILPPNKTLSWSILISGDAGTVTVCPERTVTTPAESADGKVVADVLHVLPPLVEISQVSGTFQLPVTLDLYWFCAFESLWKMNSAVNMQTVKVRFIFA
jgi:hypothetical protein